MVRDSLNQNQSENIAEGDLLDLIRRARCFGINLAKLDIRQESARHTQLISEIIKKKYNKNYLSWSESMKLSFLSSQIKNKKNLISKSLIKNKENKEVWSTFNILKDQPTGMFRGLCYLNDFSSIRYIICYLLTKRS